MLLTKEQLKTCTDVTGQEIVYRDGHYWMKRDAREYLLMPWRANKRLSNMRTCILDGSVRDISVMKSECVVQRCFPLSSLAAKELDICEWVLDDRIAEVFALTDETHVFHLIGRMKSGRRITIDISNNLHENVRETERHEVISSNGSLVDLPVGMQLATEDIYAFTADCEHPQVFSEVILGQEFYTREQAAIIRDVRSLLLNEKELETRESRMDELQRIVHAAFLSSKELKRKEIQA
ncbi:MAG: hypothetical protein IKU34_11255 [Clostridia bacterium]|nr:hypothetical protein [Clostridia bacterium]